MKKEFSTKWTGSSQPRKQRKYLANAPLHSKRKALSVNLSKDLRTKQETRNVVVNKGDKVKILRGKFKGKTGKVIEVQTKLLKIYIEGIQTTKTDGSKVNVPLRASNLQVIELNVEDKKRFAKKKTTKNSEKKEIISSVNSSKKENMEEKK